MPLIAFACPESAPTYGEAHEFEYCITSCKNRCLSPYLLAAVAASNQANIHRGRYISATSLSGCIRKLALERTIDYAQEPKKCLYGYRGTVMHTVLEDATAWKGFQGKSLLDLGFLSEWNMKLGYCFKHKGFPLPEGIDATDQETWKHVECPACCDEKVPVEEQEWFVLGGTLDGGEPLWDQFDPETGTLYMVLHDLKTMKEYAVNKFIFGDPEAILHTHTKDAYVTQANIYRYLAERSVPPQVLRDQGVKNIKFTHARIQAFSMGEFPYMGASYMARKHYKHEFKPIAIPSIEFFDIEWVEELISTRGRAIYDSFLTERNRPPICEPSGKKGGSHSWQCDFCVFHGSEHCPAPKVEWELLEAGFDPEAAFEGAQHHQVRRDTDDTQEPERSA